VRLSSWSAMLLGGGGGDAEGGGGYADAPGSGLTRMSGRSGRPGSGPSQTSIEKGSFQSPPGSFESTTGREEGGGGYADPGPGTTRTSGSSGERPGSFESVARSGLAFEGDDDDRRSALRSMRGPMWRRGRRRGVRRAFRLAFVGHVRRSIDESSRPVQISEPQVIKGNNVVVESRRRQGHTLTPSARRDALERAPWTCSETPRRRGRVTYRSGSASPSS
jgi:hypothetical protein